MDMQIDFLYLDLETCTRCRAADRSLEAALEATRDVLATNAIAVDVNRIHVESADQARELRFVSSPTIRVNGRDVALELRESSCGSEACTDGCGESIACRVWVYGDEEHSEPPLAMITNAILREAYGGSAVEREPGPEGYTLPENLERFFAGKALTEPTETRDEPGCCPPAELGSCCDAEDKAECCGTATAGSCGCERAILSER